MNRTLEEPDGLAALVGAELIDSAPECVRRRPDQDRVIGELELQAVHRQLTSRERELANTVKRLHATLAHAPIGMALTARNGRWLQVNRALCEMLGYEEHELVTMSSQDLTHPDDLDAGVEDARRLFAGEIDSYETDKRYVGRSGKQVWTHLSVSLLRDTAGQPRFFIAQMVDISGRKSAERKLAAERCALDEAQRIAHVGSWAWDVVTAAAEWSSEMYRIFDRDPAAGPCRQDELLAVLHPDDRRRVATESRQRFGERSDLLLDGRIIRDDGSVRWLRAIGRLDPERSGVYVGTVQDVTELREAELEAVRRREHTEAVLTAMTEGYVLSVDGAVIEVNDALCVLTGFSRDELVGSHSPAPFLPPESHQLALVHRHRALKEDRHTFEITFMRKTGERFEAEVTVQAAHHPDGSVLGLVSTIRDITERKRRQAELELLATQDPLTGLLNHRMFHGHLEAEAGRARRDGRPLSVAILDLDHFKAVNDRHGHPIGDLVLREAAARLRRLVGPGEHLARIGGEEFAWILPNTTEVEALAAAERARLTISARPLPAGEWLTLSGGVCELSDSEQTVRLYEYADQALYIAKQRGRNRTIRYATVAAANWVRPTCR